MRCCICLVCFALSSSAASHFGFSDDPSWEGFRNRLLSPKGVVRQDFGYRTSNIARGQAVGEIGGWIQRSITPAYYAKSIRTKTLNDKLSASGRFTVTNDSGTSGVLFGWFNENSRGWRTPNSLGLRLDGNGGKYWVFFEYGTSNWLTGAGATFEGRYQTTTTKPFLADGTSHQWTFSYDPSGHGGRGEMVLVLDGATYREPLLEGHKEDGASFNRFGIWNQQISGRGMEVYLDDLVIDGVPEDFTAAPGWVGVGNIGQFPERAVRPKHDFGFSPTTHAGGDKGEIGGIIWRDEAPAYYARPTETLTLTNVLAASGKIAFVGAGSDSGVYIGWFNSKSKQTKNIPDHEQRQQNFLAILIEGQSRIGHYFRPGYGAADGTGDLKETGPIIKPDGRPRTWSIRYDPAAGSGQGQIIFQLDQAEQTFDLKPGVKALGATFDRFGLFNLQAGGHFVEIYLDDLTFTHSR